MKEPLSQVDYEDIKEFEAQIPLLPKEQQPKAQDFLKFILSKSTQEKEPPFEPAPATNSSVLGSVVDIGTRFLDYGPGIMRTAAYAIPAKIAEGVTGKDIARFSDLKRALLGTAPTASEYMERAGIPEGGSLADVVPGMTKGAWYDPTARGALGAITDALTTGGTTALAKVISGQRAKEAVLKSLRSNIEKATDVKGARAAKDALALELKTSPTPLLPGLMGQLSAIPAKAVAFSADPVQTAISSGKWFYKHPFHTADISTMNTNMIPPSELAYQSGLTGSAEDLIQGFKKLQSKATEERKQISALAGINKIHKDEVIRDELVKLKEMLDIPGINVEAAGVLKTIEEDLKPFSHTDLLPLQKAEKMTQGMQRKAATLGSYINPTEAPVAGVTTKAERDLLKTTYENLSRNGQEAIAKAVDEIIPGSAADYYRAGQVQATSMRALEALQERVQKASIDEIKQNKIRTAISILPGASVGLGVAAVGNPWVGVPMAAALGTLGAATGTTSGATKLGALAKLLETTQAGNIARGGKAALVQEEQSRRSDAMETPWSKLLKKYGVQK